MTSCQYANVCGGCSHWHLSYEDQLQMKTANLAIWGEGLGFHGKIMAHHLGPVGIRDKVDLQWRKGVGWGYRNRHEDSILPIEQCPLMSPELHQLFQWWKNYSLPAAKASVRLRVSPGGQWGVWLDMANIDVKTLLGESKLLEEWTAKAHVEVGQRFKVLRWDSEKSAWKLKDPEKKSWFSTFDRQGRELPLFGSIGSFTQVGRRINQLLVQRVLQWVDEERESWSHILEIGAGSGNFTLGLLASGFKVRALDQSKEAIEGLIQSVAINTEWQERLHPQVGDFLRLPWGEETQEPHLLFLDPPRSGLGLSILEQIPRGNFPAILYVACGVEAWRSDGEKLVSMGYELTRLEWVDQFPHTLHYEILSFWRKK